MHRPPLSSCMHVVAMRASATSLATLSLLDHSLNSSSPVSEELGINTLESGIALSLRLSDSVSMSFSVLVVVGVVLALCHFMLLYYLIITCRKHSYYLLLLSI